MEKEVKILSPIVQIEDSPDMGKVLVLVEPWTFKTLAGVEYTIPKGYTSDGMSCPRFFWRMLSPQLDFVTLGPSIEHDYRYENHIGTRKECDDDYYDRLVENGFPKWKAYLVWIGVRIGGGSHY